MKNTQRPTTFRALGGGNSPRLNSYQRLGNATFPALERTTIVRIRRAKNFATTPEIAISRNAYRADSRRNNNPSGVQPSRLIFHRTP